MATRKKLDRLDALLLLSLVLLFGLHTARTFDFARPPLEDAAMLMRYSQHLAEGHGIVWNIGESPVDGATDFLLMVVLALLAKAGLSLETAVRLVGFSSHVLTVLLVYLAIRGCHRSSRGIAWVSAAFLALGPAIWYVEAYFGTPFFALFACISWYLANRLALEDDPSHTTSFLFAMSGLVLGLIRPEGVLLAGFMLLSVLYVHGPKKSSRAVAHFVAVFGLLGGAYFLWRWNYFGYPLPNPFYKKGGGRLHFDSLAQSAKNVALLGFPFILTYVYAALALLLTLGAQVRAGQTARSLRSALFLRPSNLTRQTIFSLLPLVGFIGAWVLLSNEMNYLMRFQYPILPIILISWPPLFAEMKRGFGIPETSRLDGRQRTLATAGIAALVVAMLTLQPSLIRGGHERPTFQDSRYDMALKLRRFADKKYTIATTEAGLLPFYSTWNAIDTWGLNDQTIAHNGGQITESYLEMRDPEIIVFHARFSPLTFATARAEARPRGDASRRSQWSAMVMTLKDFAETNGYVLAASFGDSPYDTHYYYVKPNFPDSARIIEEIRATEYPWHHTGNLSLNYATLEPSPDD